MKLPQKVIVKQALEVVELLTHIETKNKYRILNAVGKDLLYAYEKSGFLQRVLLKKWRSLQLIIVDPANKEVMRIARGKYFLKPKHTVFLPSGEVLGYVNQDTIELYKTNYKVYDRNKNLLFTCEWDMSDAEKMTLKKLAFSFRISRNGSTIAKINQAMGVKQIVEQHFVDRNTMQVDFMRVRSEELKLLILAAAFAVELRMFEQ